MAAFKTCKLVFVRQNRYYWGMSTELQLKEIDEVRAIINRLLPLLDEAERKFKSARNWGVVDMFGGGTLSGLIKHSKINSASNIMSKVSVLLGDLQRELKDVTIPSEMDVTTGTFSTLADFVFDGFLVDVYMQTKIAKSMDEIRSLRQRLVVVLRQMDELARR